MMKNRERSLVLSFYSLLTVLSTTTVSNGTENSGENRHSLALSSHNRQFTESLVIVGTLDGKLRGLDPAKNGKIQWRVELSDEPLLSSSLNSVQMMKELTGYRLIPSLDGGLYQFSWDKIEAMPLNADMLLSSSFKLNKGLGLVGGKSVQQMGIDPVTGKIIYSCRSGDGCDSVGSDSLRDILVVKRVQKTVRAVSERTGAERWNFSVGQHKLSLSSAHSDAGHERLPKEGLKIKQEIQVSIPEGLVSTVHKPDGEIFSTKTLWEQRFDTPVAAVWLLHNGMLEEIDLLKATAPAKSLNGNSQLPLMYYIGSHEEQLYIHPSDKMEEAVRIAIEKLVSTNDEKAVADHPKRRIIWKPYLATSASRTPAIVGETELAVRQPLDYPFDNGHYFYEPSLLGDEKCLNNNTSSKDDSGREQGFLVKLSTFFSHWWRESLIFVFTFGFCGRQIFKYWRKHSTPKKNGLKLNLPCGNLEVEIRRRSEESKSAPSSSPMAVQSPESFVSRYQFDFEHETCLGSGAFGLVFQARNKLDDCQYAVKRIRLPNNDKARTKVMREVKVLASLEHPGIVRYYNSWCEQPPVEWLREWDDKLRGDSKCPTINTVSSYTSPSSDADLQLQEMSLNDKLSDYERNVDVSKHRASRSRHDTITVENEDGFHELEWTSSDDGKDYSASLDVHFEAQNVENNSGNNNGKRSSEESSGVVFQHSSAAQNENSSSSGSRENNVETHSSEKGRFPSHLLYIQMQLCRKDSLKDWLNANTTNRNSSHSIDIFRQLVIAVDYIHQKGHIHRDLKPSNILFALDGTVKVGDFGLVAACQPSRDEDAEHNATTHAAHQNLTGQVGTQLYASPEQDAGTNCCFRADMFSLGIIFFELFHVFSTQMERLKTLVAVRMRNIPESFKENMPLQSELALWLLAENPSDRPSAEEVSKSRVFSELLDSLMYDS